MSTAPRLDLSRTRDLGQLLSESFTVYLRHFGTFVTIAATVVIPAEVIVSGIGLEQLTSGYDDSSEAVEAAIPTALSYLVITPLVTAMAVHALLQAADGEEPGVRRSVVAGLELFAAVFVAVLLAAAGIAVGLLLLVLPGIYLAVRWYFVAQAVVIDGRRGPDALRRSGELVEGSWWRVFGIGIVATLISAVPSLVLFPLELVAEAADRDVFSLAGSILAELVAAPFLAIVGTLLYFDLNARRAGRVPTPVPPAGPPDPPGLAPRDEP